MKKIRNTAASLALILAIILSFPACSAREEKYSDYSFDYFDTVTEIIGYETDKSKFDATVSDIKEMLLEYHRLYDIYNEYEGIANLATVNAVTDGAHSVVKVDRKILDMLAFAKEVYSTTDGYVNVAMGSVLSIWHDYRLQGEENPQNASLPTDAELSLASAHTAIDSLLLDFANSTVFISDPCAKLDVGAVAKGFAVEKIAQELVARGVSGYMLNVGGNTRSIGARPDGTGWKVGIDNPDSDEENPYLDIVEMSDMALVTSGSYQRFYVVNGKNYHHIIDKNTLYPADLYVSVSVLCYDSGLADALSTALFCMPREQGLALVESLEGVEAMWCYEGGERLYSSGFKK